MYRRRLAAAVVMSLGFHGVLLAVVGIGIVSKPVETDPDGIPPRAITTTVRLAAPHPKGIQSPVEIPGAEIPVAAPVPKAVPASITPSVIDKTDIEVPVAEVVEADPVDSPDTGVARGSEASELAVSGEGVANGLSSGIPADSEPSLLSIPNPEYPILARRMGVEGVVILDVTVDQEGIPVDCLILAPRSHRVLEESALAAVMKARFRPGTEDGKPVRDIFRLNVRFELSK